MKVNDLNTAAHLVQEIYFAAEAISEVTRAQTIDSMVWYLRKEDVAYEAVMAEMKRIIIAHRTAGLAAMRTKLAPLSIELTDGEIEAHVAEHVARQEKWKAEREAKERAEEHAKASLALILQT